ncbi:hypothetical protein D9M71_560210 [compost metagenome]
MDFLFRAEQGREAYFIEIQLGRIQRPGVVDELVLPCPHRLGRADDRLAALFIAIGQKHFRDDACLQQEHLIVTVKLRRFFCNCHRAAPFAEFNNRPRHSLSHCAPKPVYLTLSAKGDSSATRQILQGVNWLSLTANLKMQFHPISSGRPHLCNFLAGLDLLPLPNQQPAVVSVGTDVSVAMLDDNQLTVSPEPITGVYHTPGRCRHNRLA